MFFLFYLLVIVIGIALGFLAIGVMESVPALIVVISAAVIVMVVIGVIQGALSGIFQATVYRYAETGATPDNFDIELIQGAFKPKRKRG